MEILTQKAEPRGKQSPKDVYCWPLCLCCSAFFDSFLLVHIFWVIKGKEGDYIFIHWCCFSLLCNTYPFQLWVKILPLLSFYKVGFGIKQLMKVDMPLNKEIKPKLIPPS